MATDKPPDRRAIVRLLAQGATGELVDKGLLIEAGWQALRLLAMDPQAPPTQLSEMRIAFFAGAQHLYSSIMTMLEPGADPSTKDLTRMELLDAELEAFRKELELRLAQADGHS